jgi:hypothetical protein
MKYIYPDGVSSAGQHRDVIRCFLMGWVEAFLARRDRLVVAGMIDEYNKTTNEKWWPDESWVWWPGREPLPAREDS